MYRFACYILILSLAVTSVATAQTNKVDSLKSALRTTNNYKQIAAIYLTLGEVLKSNDPENALLYFNKTVSIAKENHDQVVLSKSNAALGKFYFDQGNMEKSTEYYFKALDGLFEHPDHYELLAKLNNSIGWNFQKQQDYKRALLYYDESKKYVQLSGDGLLMGTLLNNIGMVYRNQGDLKKALDYFKQALKYNREQKNMHQQLNNINNIGVIYLNNDRYSLAIEYFAEALRINYELGEYGEVATNLHNLGVALFKSGEVNPARDTLIHSLEICDRMNLADLKQQVLKDLYELSQDQEQYKDALEYFTTYKALHDSLYKKGQYTSLVELEAKYKVSQNERAMQLSQTQLLNQRLINAVILAALFLAVLLIAFLTWIFLIKKKNEKVLIELNEEIDSQNAKIQAINQNLEMTIEQRTKTIQAQNIRLKEFAFMNSHNIRRPLSSILGLINLLKEERETGKVQELVEMVDTSAKEMDDIIFEINQKLGEENI